MTDKVKMPDEPAGVGFESWKDFTHPQVLNYIDALRQSALAFKERAEQLGAENEQLKQQLDVYLARE